MPKRAFHYKSAGGTKVSTADFKRIDELKIPPAWSDAWINLAAGGAVQAIGRDAAGRLQSLYHANHVRRQEARKFYELPISSRNAKVGWGQAQRWFLCRLLAPRSSVRPDQIEFTEADWVTANRLIQRAVPFRIPIYQRLISEFGL